MTRILIAKLHVLLADTPSSTWGNAWIIDSFNKKSGTIGVPNFKKLSISSLLEATWHDYAHERQVDQITYR